MAAPADITIKNLNGEWTLVCNRLTLESIRCFELTVLTGQIRLQRR